MACAGEGIPYGAYVMPSLSANEVIRASKNPCSLSVLCKELAFAMTSSTRWCMTRSAWLSSPVACRFTMTTWPPAFLVSSGRSAHGKICRDVPRQTHRSAHLHHNTFHVNPGQPAVSLTHLLQFGTCGKTGTDYYRATLY